MSCSGCASMHTPNMIVSQSSFQQPSSNLCVSFGCFVCTLAAMATAHAMSGLDFCASHCTEPTS
eukprot:3942622-Prorocentrum_lima.AAC.1